MRFLHFLSVVFILSTIAVGQEPTAKPFAKPTTELYATSNCMGCHGQSGMGGIGPPIAKTTLSAETFQQIVRDGKGMMPATPRSQLSDDQLLQIYSELKEKPYASKEIPIAFKVAQALTTKNVARVFLITTIIAFCIGLFRLYRWIKPTGLGKLWPSIKKLGLIRSSWIVTRSLIVDGLFVSSLWKSNKHRWFMHGLMLYGFIGLLLADILLSIFNPTRSDLPLTHPLKLLPIVSGLMLLFGIMYVMYRYRSDSYIDNGLTLSGDFLFVNLMFHSAFAGFLTLAFSRLNLIDWVMTIYIYHLVVVVLLILTAPFSRFQHAWGVPILAAITRLTEAVTESQVDIGFQREPCPGRHHKSLAIAESVMESLGPDYEGKKIVMRYYP